MAVPTPPSSLKATHKLFSALLDARGGDGNGLEKSLGMRVAGLLFYLDEELVRVTEIAWEEAAAVSDSVKKGLADIDPYVSDLYIISILYPADDPLVKMLRSVTETWFKFYLQMREKGRANTVPISWEKFVPEPCQGDAERYLRRKLQMMLNPKTKEAWDFVKDSMARADEAFDRDHVVWLEELRISRATEEEK